ncbi:MAG TPA: Stk1 family PASTA domain-containing Ser/Thr kinase [Micromonosporaceae bacterium]|nr:Stk1 family PASTA domain-containing Ser/Thr kinase [Micromonosporaceae bacterium]
MDTQVADPLLGTVIDGRYRVRARVARGGMATVYAATDERLERTVALKVIHPAQARDPRFVDRFIDEAETIARLTHPNVVAVYDEGSHAGLPYLVMEYVRGRTLRDILAERRRLNPVEALAILEQMLAAIASAHRAGLVHRDVKPENVLVAEAPSGGAGNLVDAVVKVADFGLARAVEASAHDAGGQLMATVAYVAPELVTDGHADPRTDVYSAGIVLFEMLTGRVPYQGGRPVDIAWQHVDQDVPAPSKYVAGLPPVLDELVARATRREPGARPSDAGVMLAEVQAARDDIGMANAATAVLQPMAQPTVVVAPVRPAQRPAWARLPSSRRGPGGQAVPVPLSSWRERLHHLHQRVFGHPQGRTGLVAGIAVVGLLLAAGGWWFTLGRYTTAPAFGSLPRAQAEQKAAAGGFDLVFDDGRHDEKVAKDVVLAQRPGPGERIRKGGQITLTLSLGPERYQVPDIIGAEYEVAATQLRGMKLVVQRANDRYSDTVPAGNVLAVEPKVGTALKPGDKVTVTVSKGKAPLTVPNVTGRNVNDARQVLQAMGLVVEVEDVDSPKPPGEVVEQNPADGAGVEPGATVKLKVSKGPPMVAVPDVTSGQNVPCRDAEAALRNAGLTVAVQGNIDTTARVQSPGPGAQVPAGTQVTILCL